jgi:hypothetical protein
MLIETSSGWQPHLPKTAPSVARRNRRCCPPGGKSTSGAAALRGEWARSHCAKTMSGLYATVLPCSDWGLERKGRPVERMRCLNERATASRVRRLDGIKVPSTEGRNNRRGSNTTGPWSHHRATSVADYAFRFRKCDTQSTHVRHGIRTLVVQLVEGFRALT